MITGLLVALPSAALVQTIPQSREQIQLSFAPVAKMASPAVVNIYTKRKIIERGSPFFRDPFFEQFFGGRYGMFGMPRERVVSSLGSGVIIDPKGVIVTNYHVIAEADDIIVVLNDRRELNAEITLRDEQSDLALLQLNDGGDNLPYLRLRDSDQLAVGDLVLAIGNPFGVGQTVTSGIISAPARSAAGINDFGFFIQTDAAINPGNSGGALVDLEGRLLGVPSAIYSRSGGSNGIGFAIPANMVRSLLGGEVKNGKIRRAWLGARYRNITREFADSLGLKRSSGVLIEEVYRDSPADAARLKTGDVIIALNGKPVNDMQELRFRIATEPMNRALPLEIIRDEAIRTLKVTLALPPENPPREALVLKGAHPLRDIPVANLNPALAIELGMDPARRGVVVTENARNLRRGDIIASVNGERAESTRQLERLLRRGGPGWQIDFIRDGQTISLRIVR